MLEGLPNRDRATRRHRSLLAAVEVLPKPECQLLLEFAENGQEPLRAAAPNDQAALANIA